MTTRLQRVRQGWRALLAFSRPVDFDLADEYLNPAQMALFHAMRRNEQLHSLNVLRAVLRQANHTPHDLAVAALLHDAGKIRYPIAIWQKVGIVLVRGLMRNLYQRLSAGDPEDAVARPFVVYAEHPRWSGDLLRDAGGTDRACWLVTHHQDDAAQWAEHPHVDLLRRLQAADDVN